MNYLWAVVIAETLWLATIYGRRFFDAWDRAADRLDALLDEYENEVN